MNITVHITPSTVPQPPSPHSAAVVIDILRATSTMAQALYLGADSIQVFASKENLLEFANALKRPLLLGERGGQIIPGFHHGNSPLELEADELRGAQVLMTTTNGTRAIEAVKHWPTVITVALINRMAVAKHLTLKAPDSICLVCAGWKGTYSLEDMTGAGALISALDKLTDGNTELGNDEALDALTLFKAWKDDLYGLLIRCSHGKRLMKLGAEKDLKWCAGLDKLGVAPVQASPGLFRTGIIS